MPEQPIMSMAEANAMLTAPGQMFEIEEIDIGGVATKVWKGAPPTLRAVFDMTLAHGDATFLVYEDERLTFAEHYRQAATLARRLREEFGIETGDRVAIAMRNLPEWVIAFWAAAAAGAVVVPLNAWWTGDELAYGLENSGSKIAFVDTERAGHLKHFLDGLDGLRTVVVADEARGDNPATASAKEITFARALGDVAPDASPPDVAIGAEDDATIFYTSGTTGRP
jgi:long-chain acyl-CoA synthetase